METKIVSEKDQPMMVMSRVRGRGLNLEITGRMMGAWPSKMYVTPTEFAKLVLMSLRPTVLLFVVFFPIFWLVSVLKRDKR